MLVNKCYLKDIRDFEEEQKINVLRLFENISISSIKMLLSIIYRNISDEEKYRIIDEYLQSGKGLVDMVEELRNIILGYDVDKYKNREIPDELEEISSLEDVTQYEYLHDFYIHLCMQLMHLGMTYNEFWSLTTKEMYQTYDAMKQKMIMDYNKDMREYHMLANMIAGAVWNKGLKEPPQIDIEEVLDQSEEINTPYGRMTREDYKNFMAMENYMNKVDAHNRAMEVVSNG